VTEEKKKYDKPLKYMEATYVGKEFTRTFENDGKSVKGYKFLFKTNLSDQYPKKLWGTENTKGADLLMEGDEFVIGYAEKPIEVNGKPAVLKQAKFFGVHEKQERLPQDTPKDLVTPDGMQEWVDEVVKNSEDFKENFAGDNGRELFFDWMKDKDKSETDYLFRFPTDDEKKFRANELYDLLMQAVNEVI